MLYPILIAVIMVYLNNVDQFRIHLNNYDNY